LLRNSASNFTVPRGRYALFAHHGRFREAMRHIFRVVSAGGSQVSQVAGTGGGEDLPPEVLQHAAAMFGLLASTMRLHIVWALAEGEADVGTLAERTGGTLPTISQHLAKLKLAGLVRSRREGRRQVYLVGDPGLVRIVRQMVGSLQRQHAGPGRTRGVGA
jgi:DNA-binding transcriptional ArsR family regulator